VKLVKLKSNDIRVFYSLAIAAILIGGLGQFPLIEAQLFLPICDDMIGSAGNQGQNPGSIFLVSKVDGSQTFIGDPTLSGGVSGLAHLINGDLYGTTVSGPVTSELIKIDSSNGNLLNTLPIFDETGVFVKMSDMGRQPGTNTLFGLATGAHLGNLYSINELTGVATFRGNTGSNVGAIGFAPDGTLFFVPRSDPTLRTLDPSDGSQLTSVARSESIELDALGIQSNGVIFVAGTPFFGDGRDIWTIATDGSMIFIGNGVRQVADLSFVPCAIGGSMIPLDSTALLLQGVQTTGAWLIPVIVATFGIAIIIARKF